MNTLDTLVPRISRFNSVDECADVSIQVRQNENCEYFFLGVALHKMFGIPFSTLRRIPLPQPDSYFDAAATIQTLEGKPGIINLCLSPRSRTSILLADFFLHNNKTYPREYEETCVFELL